LGWGVRRPASKSTTLIRETGDVAARCARLRPSTQRAARQGSARPRTAEGALPRASGEIQDADARAITPQIASKTDLTVGAELLECRPRHGAQEFWTLPDDIARSIPPDFEVHLVLDNLRAHKARLIRGWLAKRPRYYLYFTPASLIPFGAQP